MSHDPQLPQSADVPLDALVGRLANAGWGALSPPQLRGLREVLLELGNVLPPESAAGEVTAPQLANACGYSERWVRRCLTLLESLDVIEWRRGGIIAGQPSRSWIRASKAALVDLIRVAHDHRDAKDGT